MLKKLIFQYVLIFSVFTLLYIISFHSPILAGQKVLFYRGLALLTLITLITAGLVILFKKKLKIGAETAWATIIVSAAINLALFITFPITYDRSITTYLLDRLNNPPNNNVCKGYSEPELEQRLLTEYIQYHQALKKRLYEQSVIKFIQQDGRCISITEKAKKFLQVSEIIKKVYGVAGY